MRPNIALHVAFLTALAAPVRAVTVVVPTDFPTIAAALASGADEIHVADGDFSGNLTINRPVVLRARPSDVAGSLTAAPVVLGNITFTDGASSGIARLQGFRVFGDVHIETSFAPTPTMEVQISECRVSGWVDRGAFAGQSGVVSLRGCIVERGVSLNPNTAQLAFVTVLDGGVSCPTEGYGSYMHNHIEALSPTSPGLVIPNVDGGVAQDNTIVGTQDGMNIGDPDLFTVRYNVIAGVARDGIAVEGGTGCRLLSNAITDAGRHGIALAGINEATANFVERPAEVGILTTSAAIVTRNTVRDAGSDGIRLSVGSSAYRADENVVVGSGANGIIAGTATSISYNVVGRNRLDGIRADAAGVARVANNTVYLNDGNGFRIGMSPSGGAFEHNIVFGNSLVGLHWLGGGASVRCNDWFGNIAGNASGIGTGMEARFVNPLFCGLPVDDMYLSDDSPLVGTTCGTIGALGTGCSGTVGVGDPVSVGTPGLELGPNPSSGDVRFAWRQAASGGSARLEIFDVQGAARWARDFRATDRHYTWNGRDADGRILPPGLYMARVRLGEETFQQRLIRVR